MSLKTMGVLIVVSILLAIYGCGKKGSADRAKIGQEQQTQEQSIESGGSVQQTCPVTGNPIDEDLYVDYDGKRIFVADSLSLEVIQNDPEKYLRKLQQMGEVPQPLH